MSDQIGFQGPSDLEIDAGDLHGLYMGKVMDNEDPKKLGRVKAHIIQTRKETDWAYPVGIPGAGGVFEKAAKGGFYVPRLEATILVGFFNGNIQYPFYLPAQYVQSESTAEALVPRIVGQQTAKQAPNVRVIAETETFEIYITDTPTSKKIMLATLDGGTYVEIDAIDGSLKLKSAHSIIIEADGDLKLNGTNVTIQDRPVSVVGMMI